MPGWRCCRPCWDARWATGPNELPTRQEGIAIRFGERPNGQLFIDEARAA
jgi:hypothetical protein